MLIFNFHHVEPEPLHPDRKHITITPSGLRNFIRFLRAVGYEPISMREVLENGGPLPSKQRRVLLTFDDGFENFAEYAVPVLESEQCPGTVFVLAGGFSGTNHWDQGHLSPAERDQLMSLERIKEVSWSPYVDVGSHGLLHRDFSRLPVPTLDEAINGSYEILENELGDRFLPVLAYPWGRYGEDTLAVLKRSRYRYAFTTAKGSWTPETPVYEVPRYSAYYRDGNPCILFAKLCRNGLLFA